MKSNTYQIFLQSVLATSLSGLALTAQAAFILTDNQSLVEIDGYLDTGIDDAGYDDFDDSSSTILPLSYNPSIADQVNLAGGLSSASASLDLAVNELGNTVSLSGILDTSGLLQMGSNIYGDVSAVSSIDLFFTLDTAYDYNYTAQVDSSLRAGTLYDYATLYSVQGLNQTEVFGLQTLTDIENWNGAGQLLAGDYYLTIQVETAFQNIDIDTGANGTFDMSLTQASVVPVPAAAWLMMAGLLGLAHKAIRRS